MLTVKEIYDNYPNIECVNMVVDKNTTLHDVEETEMHDTLFLFLCRELCNPDDPVDLRDAIQRCNTARTDIDSVLAGLLGRNQNY